MTAHPRRLGAALLLVLAIGAVLLVAQRRRSASPPPVAPPLPSALPRPLDPTPACSATLDEAQARAFDTGLAAVTGKGTHVSTHDQTLTFYSSDDMVCMGMAWRCALADRFAAEGPRALQDPVATTRRIVLDFRDRPQRGVLHAPLGWYEQAPGGPTDDQLTMAIGELMDSCGAYAGYGFIHTRVYPGPALPPTNQIIFFVGHILEELGGDRIAAANDDARTKAVLVRMITGDAAGAMWSHPPTPAERAEARRCVERSTRRPTTRRGTKP